jgi:hypothetical protein
MSSDAHRLSILTAEEVDDLYGLPRFTAEDQRLYFDVSAAERAVIDAGRTTSVAVHFMLQLGYFKAKRQFFLYGREAVRDDVCSILQEYFPAQDVAFHHAAIQTHPPSPAAAHSRAVRLSRL